MVDIVPCPECDAPAEVLSEGWVTSTDGPVEHVRVWCMRRHWFLMPRHEPHVVEAPTTPTRITAKPAASR